MEKRGEGFRGKWGNSWEIGRAVTNHWKAFQHDAYWSQEEGQWPSNVGVWSVSVHLLGFGANDDVMPAMVSWESAVWFWWQCVTDHCESKTGLPCVTAQRKPMAAWWRGIAS